jgi:hypothetical protein
VRRRWCGDGSGKAVRRASARRSRSPASQLNAPRRAVRTLTLASHCTETPGQYARPGGATHACTNSVAPITSATSRANRTVVPVGGHARPAPRRFGSGGPRVGDSTGSSVIVGQPGQHRVDEPTRAPVPVPGQPRATRSRSSSLSVAGSCAAGSVGARVAGRRGGRVCLRLASPPTLSVSCW